MKYILLLLILISVNPLIAQDSVLIKYDEEIVFEDSISLEEYLIFFKRSHLVSPYIKKDEKTLVDRDTYHITYYCNDSTAKEKVFRINQYSEKIDTSFYTKNTFFYFQKGDKIFIKYLEYNEPKYRLQYDLKAPTMAKQSWNDYYDNSYFYSEDYIYVSNTKYDCYVFEEINNNYRRLVYIGKENGFLLKTMTFGGKSIDIVEAYEINLKE